jgi:hypothetical protein
VLFYDDYANTLSQAFKKNKNFTRLKLVDLSENENISHTALGNLFSSMFQASYKTLKTLKLKKMRLNKEKMDSIINAFFYHQDKKRDPKNKI